MACRYFKNKGKNLKQGKDQFVDWEQAKKEIRDSTR
jgi:hypothetical protein